MDDTPVGYSAFTPIKEGCLTLVSYYPSGGNTDRCFIVRAICKGEIVREENVSWGNQNPYGPDVDDFLKLEQTTQKIINEVECKCS